ncbi:hypothetical protein RIF29_19830 [Crotalaria pallida]|uniref:Uncharacterized protein n=1 Tax=Crotalaria pallida TaxID=3830 RepID=A0AAN9F392_CROPI
MDKADTGIEDDESLNHDATTYISLAKYLEDMSLWDMFETIEKEKISIRTYLDAINFAYSMESSAAIMQSDNARAELDSFKKGIVQLSKTFKRRKSLESKHETLCRVIKDIISRRTQIELLLKELKVEVTVKDLEEYDKEEKKESKKGKKRKKMN